MSLLTSMQIASSGLNTNQYGIQVISNNISNMNTPGYSKQRIDFIEKTGYTPITTAHGVLQYTGAGVAIDGIFRYSNAVMYNDYLKQTSVGSNYDTLVDSAEDISAILNETSTDSLAGLMTAFYSSAQELTSKPTDSVLRINFMQNADNLAIKFNELSTKLTDTRKTLVGDFNEPSSIYAANASQTVDSINTILEKISSLNTSIINSTTSSGVSNALLDQRDSLLKELSGLIDFSTKENINNSVDISIGGTVVLKGDNLTDRLSITLGTADDPTVVQIVTNDEHEDVRITNIKDKITGGSLSAILTMGSNDANTYTCTNVIKSLNTLATTFATEVNKIQHYNDGNEAAMAIGFDADNNRILIKVPTTAKDIFTSSDGTDIDASNIKVNSTIYNDTNLIATARVKIDVDGNPLEPKAIGNTDNLKALNELQYTRITPELSGYTMSEYWNNLVETVGNETNKLQSLQDAQNSILDQIKIKYDSAVGVNMEEEFIDLIKFQRAYEASARVYSVCNNLVETLVNLGR